MNTIMNKYIFTVIFSGYVFIVSSCGYRAFTHRPRNIVDFKMGDKQVSNYSLFAGVGNATVSNTLILKDHEGNNIYTLETYSYYDKFESKNLKDDSTFSISLYSRRENESNIFYIVFGSDSTYIQFIR